MSEGTIKIGVFGGTFNPIHCGHLIIAEFIREDAGLDKIIFMPAGQPPRKSDKITADPEKRYEMVQMAVQDNRNFEVSRMEIDRKAVSYTVDTLRALKGKYGEDTDLYFLGGADIVPELDSWMEPAEIFRLSKIIIASRPGYGEDKDLEMKIRQLKDKYDAEIFVVKTPLIEISSGEIRERLQRGKTIKYLVPDQVEGYIYREGLYGPERERRRVEAEQTVSRTDG